jgi:hypothetical protein
LNARSTTPSNALVQYGGDFHIPEILNYNDFAYMLYLATPDLNKRIRVLRRGILGKINVTNPYPAWRFAEGTKQEDIDNFIRVSAQVKSLQKFINERGYKVENGWLVNRTPKEYNDGSSITIITMRRINISFYPSDQARHFSMAEMFKEMFAEFSKAQGGR